MLTAFVINPVPEHRIVWNGGNSTMFHFEIKKHGVWQEIDCQTFMEFPASIKEIYAAMNNYYQTCLEAHELNKD